MTGTQNCVTVSRADKTLTAAGAAVLCLLIVFLKSRNIVSFWYQPCLQVYSLLAAGFVLSRVALACCYRPPKDVGWRPGVSIVVPIKNEEGHIEQTIRSIFESDYPAELYRVIAVDDGSTDGTWPVLQSLGARYARLETIRFDKNRGKRHAMAAGAERSTAEILIFMDSDSLVEPDAIRAIVQPFADPRIGAVAGHCNVLDEPPGLISRMESVRYYVAQRVIKAAESVFNAVTCCPGPFSAYRREAVMRVLAPWRDQTFLGTAATFGDDRSLTNFILRDQRVVYHAGAVTWTFTPTQWRVYFRQQLRWKKSFMRETTIAARHMWRKHPVAALSYYLSILITMASPVVATRAMMGALSLTGLFAFITYAGGLALMYLLFGLIYRYFTRSSYWHYGIAFAIIYIFVLSFQNYYALLTVRRNHWGTR